MGELCVITTSESRKLMIVSNAALSVSVLINLVSCATYADMLSSARIG